MNVLEERNLASCRCRVVDLTCRRGPRVVFAGLGFALQAGECARVRGPNGSGKTTLLKALAGLVPPSRGSITLAPDQRVGYIGHSNALNDGLTAAEALRFLAKLHGPAPTPDAVDAALQRIGMGAQAARPVRSLSQGQRRRVALARLALQPDVGLWLLDEPFDALDDDGIAAVDALLAEHLARGGAVALAAHGDRRLGVQPTFEVALGGAR